ncbi:MAG: IscS subfamily cysteine desulfurase [Clostridia bacterium]|nr:IscS subfamily cysteine desulfurase [Clostridia bacterium]
MNRIYYFDHAATTAVDEEVLREMIPYFSYSYGNPSSAYTIGRQNKMAIHVARQKVAKAIKAKSKEIYFTGCGSESDNLALKGITYANSKNKKHIITTKIEHHAILNTCKTLEQEGIEVTYLNVDKDGKINLQELENCIKDDTILISIMTANNEIGTIQPIKEIGEIARKHKILFHTDAVQAIGNIKIDVEEMNIDLLSMSAHKFYGPKGVGALYVKDGINFREIQDGGHQENGKRAGTENVAGIVGMGKAIELAYENIEEYNKKLIELREYCIEKLQSKIGKIKINGARKDRLPGNINISFLGEDSSDLLLKLDERGICTSAGSACSTGDSSPSHVLMAIGLNNEEAEGALRITLGKENTKQDIDYLISNIVAITTFKQ